MESASVIICSHSIDRLPDLHRAVESALRQSLVPAEVIVVVDHAPDLYVAAVRSLGVTVVENTRSRGASGARNAGSLLATGTFLAFLDDDAEADPGWLEHLVGACEGPDVAGSGGLLLPAWAMGRAPTWFPESFLWVVGASKPQDNDERLRVRNVWSGSMCISRSVFERIGGFREGFGKLGNASAPEDTDLCIRAAEAVGSSAYWVFVPKAVAFHSVPKRRSTFAFFIKRCFNEGRGKAALHSTLGGAALSEELRFASRLFRFHGTRSGGERRTEHGYRKAAAALCGLGAAIIGFAIGKVTGHEPADSPRQ